MAVHKPSRQRTLSLASIVGIVLLMGAPAAAQPTVTFTITGNGPLRAHFATESPFHAIGETIPPFRDRTRLRLIVNDPRGTSAGWSVYVSSTDFVPAHDAGSTRVLSADSLRIERLRAPVLIAGRPIGPGGPSFDPHPGTPLADARTVFWAEPGWGSGDYALDMVLSLAIPPGSWRAHYMATLTVAIASGP